MGSRNVKNTNMAKSHMFPNKMNIQLNMLGPTMMYRVSGDVDCRDVVAVDHRSTIHRARELLKQLVKPQSLGDDVGHNTILSLSTGSRDHRLPLGRPRDERGSKEDT